MGIKNIWKQITRQTRVLPRNKSHLFSHEYYVTNGFNPIENFRKIEVLLF